MKTQLRSLFAGCVLAISPAFAQTANSTLNTNNVLACTAPVADEIQTLCTGSRVSDIVAQTNTGAVIHWYLVGFILQEIPATQVVSDGSRYGVTQTVDGCTSPFTYVVTNLVDAPAEPGGVATQDFNTGETIASLEVTGNANTLKWYTRNEAMEYLPVQSDALLVNGTTYYVTQSNGNCESAYHAITVNEILSTDNQVLKSFSVYPNPATSVVNITSKNLISQITVINFLGQKVLSVANSSANAAVNIASLLAGTYALQVITPQGTATVKVVKL
jgi:hypothetical protein